MVWLEKWYILTPLQKLPKNVRDLGKLIGAKDFKKLPKVQKSPDLVTLVVGDDSNDVSVGATHLLHVHGRSTISTFATQVNYFFQDVPNPGKSKHSLSSHFLLLQFSQSWNNFLVKANLFFTKNHIVQ